MDISNSTNISTQIATSISKLKLNTARRAFEVQKNEENTPNIELLNIKKDDIQEYYKVKDADLFISSGMGTNGPGFRLFCRPSINFLRLSNK